jgi:hypothetical protein
MRLSKITLLLRPSQRPEDGGARKARRKLARPALILAVLAMVVLLVPAPGSAAPVPGRANVLIKNDRTGKCVDIPGFGSGSANGPVTQYTCRPSNVDNQLWGFHDLGTYPGVPWGGHIFGIQNNKDTRICLDLPGFGSVPSGTSVIQYWCNPHLNDNQIWYWDYQDGDWFLVNLATSPRHPNNLGLVIGRGLCLDVAGNRSTANDVRLTVSRCTTGDDQWWHTQAV